MEFIGSIEEIIYYAKNGNDYAYEKLSTKSKEKLKGYSKSEIVDSIASFFLNKAIVIKDYRSEHLFNYVGIQFFDTKKKQFYQVVFLKENNEWKLQWNEELLEENR